MRISLIAAVIAASISFAAPAPAAESVELTFPQDPAVTTFRDSWGAGRSGGRRHAGTDLMAPKLSPVFAAADGIVSRIHWSSLGGHGIWIDHAGGVTTVYLHLNNDTPGTDDGDADPTWTYAPGIEEGVEVTAGQFIGFVGDSGNAENTGSHTHFELHLNGSKVNPYPYLRDAFERTRYQPPAAQADTEEAPITAVLPASGISAN